MKHNETHFIEVCGNSQSMRQASIELDIPLTTFVRHAKRLGVYKTNQSGKGLSKKSGNKIPLEDILNGDHKQYKSSDLHRRLVNAGFKEEKCELCGITEWNDNKLSFDLDHIDGDSSNNLLDNLRIICPNCHSQTPTYRGRSRKHKNQKRISDQELIVAMKSTENFSKGCLRD